MSVEWSLDPTCAILTLSGSKGKGEKAGSTDCQVKRLWARKLEKDVALENMCSMAPCRKMWQYLKIDKAETTAVRNITFKVRKYIELIKSGKSCDFNNPFSTNGKTHFGNMG